MCIAAVICGTLNDVSWYQHSCHPKTECSENTSEHLHAKSGRAPVLLHIQAIITVSIRLFDCLTCQGRIWVSGRVFRV